MVLSNSKWKHSNTDIVFPTSRSSSKYFFNKKLILVILQLETDYFSSLFISENATWSSSSSKISRNIILHEESLQNSSVLSTNSFQSRKEFYIKKLQFIHSSKKHTCSSPSSLSKDVSDIQDILLLQCFQISTGFHPNSAFSIQNAYSTRSAGFSRKLHWVPVELSTNISTSKKRRCCDIG